MSLNATTAASTASSLILHAHNHKKAVHLGSGRASEPATSGTSASGQVAATTRGLFSSLLKKTVEQVAGVSPIASAAVAVVKAVTTSAPSAGAATVNSRV